LSHAHSCGIVHRDLKPANVLLANDGRPMLMDFNLSEDLQAAARGRGPIVGGTLPYMSPEQLFAFQQCSPARDPRSDIYSLGVILYVLLSGRQPFPSRNGALDNILPAMLQDRRQQPVRLRKLNRAVSPAAAAIVERCLEPELSVRYQSAAELQEDLQCQLSHRPLRHIREPSIAERTRKWAYRNPHLTSASGVAGLAVILIVILGLVLVARSRQLAKLDAASALQEFQRNLDSVRLRFLDNSGVSSTQASEITGVCQQALHQFFVPDREALQSSARYRNLSPASQKQCEPMPPT